MDGCQDERISQCERDFNHVSLALPPSTRKYYFEQESVSCNGGLLRCSQSELQNKAATGEEFGLERRSQVLRR